MLFKEDLVGGVCEEKGGAGIRFYKQKDVNIDTNEVNPNFLSGILKPYLKSQ